jgi:hypothetical protein
VRRTGQQRLDAILPAIERRDTFLARVKIAAAVLADLMAEAIDMLYEANGLETVGRDGRVTECIERVTAAHCMFAARDAYRCSRSVE